MVDVVGVGSAVRQRLNVTARPARAPVATTENESVTVVCRAAGETVHDLEQSTSDAGGL